MIKRNDLHAFFLYTGLLFILASACNGENNEPKESLSDVFRKIQEFYSSADNYQSVLEVYHEYGESEKLRLDGPVELGFRLSTYFSAGKNIALIAEHKHQKSIVWQSENLGLDLPAISIEKVGPSENKSSELRQYSTLLDFIYEYHGISSGITGIEIFLLFGKGDESWIKKIPSLRITRNNNQSIIIEGGDGNHERITLYIAKNNEAYFITEIVILHPGNPASDDPAERMSSQSTIRLMRL